MIQRDKAYIANEDTYRLFKDWGEPIFKTTDEWLSKGEERYKYLVFDYDQWTGHDYAELNDNKLDIVC